MPMKLKVRVTDIVKALEEKDRVAQSEYEKALGKFRSEERTYKGRFTKAMAAVVADLRTGRRQVSEVRDVIGSGYGRRDACETLKLPPSPTEPSEPANHREQIAQLKLSVDPFLMLTREELAECGVGIDVCVCPTKKRRRN